MARETIITEEVRQRILAIRSEPVTYEVEKGAIKKFAEAIEDPSPVYVDREQAGKSKYGDIIAPPTFFCTMPAGRLDIDLNFGKGRLNGGSEYELFEPVRAGDQITAISQIADIFEREGKMGKMVFMVTQTTYTNQHGRKVAVARGTGIIHEGGSSA